MIRILFMIVALILYGSLYPWHYRPGPPAGAFSVLLHSWPSPIGRDMLGDIVVNLLLYMPVGLFGFLAFDRRGHRELRWIAPVMIGLALSGSIEMMQVYDESRVCSLLDVLDNTIGTAAGVLGAFFFRKTISGAVFLVFYWLGFQVSTAFAIVSHKRGLPRPMQAPLDALTAVAAWALVVYMLSAREGRGTRRPAIVGIGFLALLAVRGFMPFHLKPDATPFSWVPFLSMFESDWIVGLPIFLEKSFYYGGAIWLLNRAGLRISHAASIVALALAAIEATQRYLPGRTPEISDPLLAILLGAIIWLIEEDHKRVILQVQT